MKNKNFEYEKSLQSLNLDTLEEIREILCQKFAKTSANKETIKFKQNNKSHIMQTRHTEQIQVSYCNTERLKESAIPQMEIMLNQSKMVFFKLHI